MFSAVFPMMKPGIPVRATVPITRMSIFFVRYETWYALLGHAAQVVYLVGTGNTRSFDQSLECSATFLLRVKHNSGNFCF